MSATEISIEMTLELLERLQDEADILVTEWSNTEVQQDWADLSVAICDNAWFQSQLRLFIQKKLYSDIDLD